MTEMQSQFEEWASSEGLPITYLDKHKFYESHVTDVAWQAWQASRASIVVSLPNLFDASPDGATYYDYMYRKSEMEKALDDAGVSYE